MPALFSRLPALPLLLVSCVGPVLLPAADAAAHCQVPCGIYGDELKMQQLHQHVDTVAKAAAQIQELSGSADVQDQQQLVRWIDNKESHAEMIMEEMESYFLAQRIKLPAEDASEEDKAAYMQKLAAIHGVIVHAMQVKQNADPSHAETLRASLNHFQGLYLGEGHDHAGHSH